MRSQNFALFDPRPMNRMWPEPNDDPNIPYVWGLSGYGRARRNDATIDCTTVIDLDSVESPEAKVNLLLSKVGNRSPLAQEIGLLAEFDRVLTQDDFDERYGKILCLRAAADSLLNSLGSTEYARSIGEAKAQLLDREYQLADQFMDLEIAPTAALLAGNISTIYDQGYDPEIGTEIAASDLATLQSYFENFLSKPASEVRYLGEPPTARALAELTSLAVLAARRLARLYPEHESHPIFQRVEFASMAAPRNRIRPIGAAALAVVSVGAIVGLVRGLGKGERGLDLAKSTLLGASVVGLLKGDA